MKKLIMLFFLISFEVNAGEFVDIESLHLVPHPTHKTFQYSCPNGGVVEMCLAEAESLPPHEVEEDYYISAGNFIIINASCVHPKAKFLFHSSFRLHFMSSTIDYLHNERGHYVHIDSDDLIPMGVLFVPSQSGNEKFNKAISAYPDLILYLMTNNAFKSPVAFFQIMGDEMARLTHKPECR